jgi:hypothetical protein
VQCNYCGIEIITYLWFFSYIFNKAVFETTSQSVVLYIFNIHMVLSAGFTFLQDTHNE